MVVLGVNKLLLCYYSSLSMVVIEVEFDQEVWDKIWNKVKSYLDKDHPQIIQ